MIGTVQRGSISEVATESWVDLIDRAFTPSALERIVGRSNGNFPAPHAWQHVLHAPLKEFLGRPGKEFRARLVEFGFQLSGGHGRVPSELVAVVEGFHTGSLIIDDIEDQSAYRRGLPALHCVHGVATALNAGNWLYFWPQALIEELGLAPENELAVLRAMNRTLLRCHYGQALDLGYRVTSLSVSELPGIVETTTRLKTGALCGFAASLGAIALGASAERIAELQRFGEDMGCALQMLDDWSGVVVLRRWHKGYEDIQEARPIWPWAWLAERLPPESFAKLQTMSQKVERGSLHPEQLGRRLRRLVRTSGRKHVQHCTRAALNRLAMVFGSAAAADMSRELEGLERGFV